MAARTPSKKRSPAKKTVPLDRLALGASGRVVSVNESGVLSKRIMEMGVIPGAELKVIKTAPLGDPIEIEIQGYHLALRKSEAHLVLMRLLKK